MKNQIATDISQSRRLLSCGVDPTTADMVWLNRGQYPAFLSYNEGCNRAIPEVGDVPAWSLSRLISLLPMKLKERKYNFRFQLEAYPEEDDNCPWCLSYYSYGLESALECQTAPTPIEVCVLMIEWLTEHNYSLNKIEE